MAESNGLTAAKDVGSEDAVDGTTALEPTSKEAVTAATHERTTMPDKHEYETTQQNGTEPHTAPFPTLSEKAQPAAKPVDVDMSKPEDFEGQLATNNEIPLAETLDKIKDYIVLDRDGKTHTFQSLYSGPNVSRRVLVIFVRHFFCGFCQMYLQTLSESITPDMLLRLPVSTFITVVGCGDPGLIDMYVKETGCPFPVYTDPKRSLFNALGMTMTLDLGPKPAYQSGSFFKSTWGGVMQGLKQIPKGLGLKSGDFRQIGGEFLFEPHEIHSPITTPQDEQKPFPSIADEDGNGAKPVTEDDSDRKTEEKTVTWCHRMKTTRDHAELPELMEVLGLDGQGVPIKNQKLWSKAVAQRKGTGLSMASQMSELSEARMTS